MARLINFFDGATTGTVPVVGNLVASGLVQYPDDATYEASELGAPIEGNIYFNTTDKRVRYYNGTGWISVVVSDSTDTLTNKSIDADTNTITNIDNDEIKAGAAIDATKIADGSVTSTEYQYINSLTSNAQDQIDTAQGTADANTADVADLRTTQGTADGATDLGTFPGATISDANTVKGALTEIESAVETNASDIFTLQSNPSFVFQGSYNVLTNTPTLVDGVGTTGHSYKLTTAGSRDFGAGSISFIVGDLIFYDGAVWDKDKEQVASVNGQQGVVSLDTDDISEGATNLYYTETRVNNNFATKDTDDLTEGATNLYYTNARADARIAAAVLNDLNDVTVPTPTDGDVLTWNNAGSAWINAVPSTPTTNRTEVAHISEQQATNVGGGSFTSGSFVTRTLNTIEDDFSIVTSLVSNEFTLGAGNYSIAWKAPAVQVNNHQTRLYNVTAASAQKAGSGGTCGAAESMDNWSYGSTKVTLGVSTTFRIEHRCGTTRASIGFGNNAGFAANEIYTQVTIIKDGE